MANEVKVGIGVNDNLTTQLRRIEGEVTKFHNGISRKLTQYAAGVVSGAAILGSVGTIKSFANESIEAFKQAEIADRKLQAVLKSTGMQAGITFTELKKMASGLQDVTTVDDEAIQGAEHLLLTYTKIGKSVFPEALESTLNLAEAMGTDLTSAAKQLGKALNDPLKGISSLHKIGVSFTKTQEDQIRKFVETNNIASAQAIILDELEKKYGGLARAVADTDAGKLTQMANQLDDVKETIGEKIIPLQLEWNRLVLLGVKDLGWALDRYIKAAEIAGQLSAGKSMDWIRVQNTIAKAGTMGTDDALIYLAQQRDLRKQEMNLVEMQIKKQETLVSKKKEELDTEKKRVEEIKKNTGGRDNFEGANLARFSDAKQTRYDAENKKLDELKKKLAEVNGYYNDLEAARKSVIPGKNKPYSPTGDGDSTAKPYLYKNDQLLKNIESYKAPSFDVQIPQYMIDSYNLQQQAAKEHQEALLRIQTETAEGRINLIENQYDRERAIVEARYRELYELADQNKVDVTGLKQQEADIIARINEQERQSQASFISAQLGGLASIAQGNRKFIGLYKTMALAQVGMDTVMSAVRVSKQAYEQFGKINVYAGIAAAVAAAGIVTASGVAQSAKIANMKYASGTQFAQGGYARVGENGPEDMYVPRGAMITNNRETRYNNTTNATTLNVTIIDQSGSVIDRTTRQIRDGSADDLVRAITEKAARL